MMGRPRKNTDTQEERLAQFFSKSVGVEVGLWNFYTQEFREGYKEDPRYVANVNTFRYLLNSGYAYDELHSLVGQLYKDEVRNVLAADCIPKKEVKVEDENMEETTNLLNTNEEFYHSALFDTTAPRFAVAGDSVIPVSKGAVTPKARFTLRDLMDYYYSNVNTACVAKRRATQTKTMTWLLTQASLDEVLFAIDAAADSGGDVQVIELTNYLSDANEHLEYYRARTQ